VAAFVELAARPGGVVIAKSTFYQQQNMLRLRGAAVVRGDVGFDPELGHTVAVEWREPVEVRLALGKAFAQGSSAPEVSGSLNSSRSQKAKLRRSTGMTTSPSTWITSRIGSAGSRPWPSTSEVPAPSPGSWR
jgi:hypothetical protein